MVQRVTRQRFEFARHSVTITQLEDNFGADANVVPSFGLHSLVLSCIACQDDREFFRRMGPRDHLMVIDGLTTATALMVKVR
ncbi:unnamed protein product [Acidithrix sp. C25]|nr:unnamed protein product [Acidithrix sp. C25]